MSGTPISTTPADAVRWVGTTAPPESAAPSREQSLPPEKVELIASAARGVEGVADRSGGQFGEYTTYLPGRRVSGVIDNSGQVIIAVTAMIGYPLIALADRVRTAVSALGAPSVEVVIADLDA